MSERVMLPCEHGKWEPHGKAMFAIAEWDCPGGRVVEIDYEAGGRALWADLKSRHEATNQMLHVPDTAARQFWELTPEMAAKVVIAAALGVTDE